MSALLDVQHAVLEHGYWRGRVAGLDAQISANRIRGGVTWVVEWREGPPRRKTVHTAGGEALHVTDALDQIRSARSAK